MECLIDNTRMHDLIVRRCGRIDILARVAKLLSLAPGDIVNVTASGGELYLVAQRRGQSAVGRHRCRCYKANSNTGSRNYRVNSRLLAARLLRACGASERANLWCGEAHEIGGMAAVAIITRKRVNK